MGRAEGERKDDRLYVRITKRQRALLDEAAEATDKDVSSFVLEASATYAHRVLADRRVFRLDEGAWKRFERALDAPVSRAAAKPRLRRLLRDPSVLDG